MSERIAAGLRPDREPVWHAADRNRLHRAVVGVEGVDDAVIAAREPQPLAVGAEVAHIRAAAAATILRVAKSTMRQEYPLRYSRACDGRDLERSVVVQAATIRRNLLHFQ